MSIILTDGTVHLKGLNFVVMYSIRASKFWPRLVVLKFWHKLEPQLFLIVLVSIMLIIQLTLCGTVLIFFYAYSSVDSVFL